MGVAVQARLAAMPALPAIVDQQVANRLEHALAAKAARQAAARTAASAAIPAATVRPAAVRQAIVHRAVVARVRRVKDKVKVKAIARMTTRRVRRDKVATARKGPLARRAKVAIVHTAVRGPVAPPAVVRQVAVVTVRATAEAVE